jgi:alpha-galactosidase
MLDMAKWSPEQAAAGKRQFDLYKARLRPLINSANLYHVSQRPDGVNWDAIEYFDPAAGKGAVMAFRGRKPDEPRHLFRLKGLDPAARYELTFEDGTSKPATSSGRDLMEQGVAVELPETDSSEIVWIEPRQ